MGYVPSGGAIIPLHAGDCYAMGRGGVGRRPSVSTVLVSELPESDPPPPHCPAPRGPGGYRRWALAATAEAERDCPYALCPCTGRGGGGLCVSVRMSLPLCPIPPPKGPECVAHPRASGPSTVRLSRTAPPPPLFPEPM